MPRQPRTGQSINPLEPACSEISKRLVRTRMLGVVGGVRRNTAPIPIALLCGVVWLRVALRFGVPKLATDRNIYLFDVSRQKKMSRALAVRWINKSNREFGPIQYCGIGSADLKYVITRHVITVIALPEISGDNQSAPGHLKNVNDVPKMRFHGNCSSLSQPHHDTRHRVAAS